MGIIVFLGDSITDAGRMTSDNPLGDGYVSEFAAYITGTDPNWRVLNKGVDGNITERLPVYCRGTAFPTTRIM